MLHKKFTQNIKLKPERTTAAMEECHGHTKGEATVIRIKIMFKEDFLFDKRKKEISRHATGELLVKIRRRRRR